MKQVITLDSKEVRKVISLFFGIKEEDVVPNRYSFGVTGLTEEEIKAKLSSQSKHIAK